MLNLFSRRTFSICYLSLHITRSSPLGHIQILRALTTKIENALASTFSMCGIAYTQQRADPPPMFNQKQVDRSSIRCTWTKKCSCWNKILVEYSWGTVANARTIRIYAGGWVLPTHSNNRAAGLCFCSKNRCNAWYFLFVIPCTYCSQPSYRRYKGQTSYQPQKSLFRLLVLRLAPIFPISSKRTSPTYSWKYAAPTSMTLTKYFTATGMEVGRWGWSSRIRIQLKKIGGRVDWRLGGEMNR